MAKNYYDILGVDKKASKDEIKKAYRQLSKQWHPDLCRDESKKAEYEEKFKEINEAYSVLSDDTKRQEYDNPMQGFQDFGSFGDFNFSGFNPFDAFGSFGGGRQRRSQRVPKGQSMKITMKLTLEEIYNGVKKQIKIKRYKECPTCHGSGLGKNGKVVTCPHCGGTGMEISINGSWQQMTTCSHCNGTGSIIENPCHECHGNGITLQDEIVEINIPKGSPYMLSLRGYGHAPLHAKGEYGDLIVIIAEAEHPTFRRIEDDAYMVLELNVIEALMGAEKTIQTLGGKKLNLKVSQGTVHGTKIKIANEGFARENNPNRNGDMYCVVKINLPKELNNREKELLTALQNEEHFK